VLWYVLAKASEEPDIPVFWVVVSQVEKWMGYIGNAQDLIMNN
jgi:hypothetical protein